MEKKNFIVKKDFVKMMAEQLGSSQAQTEKALDAFLSTIEKVVENGEAVRFIGYFTLEVKERKAHEGRNPATGEVLTIPSFNVVSFKAGQKLKDAANR